ncbi:MAG TPA: outer membrane beta-barrel protein [Lunatimonas sp.]|nr:outer membrane beta-barrel protein [Lunatimonas sp.]
MFQPTETFDQLNLETNQYIQNDTISNSFDFEKYVHAGYLIYRDRMGKLAYQAGLRAEYTKTNGYDYNTRHIIRMIISMRSKTIQPYSFGRMPIIEGIRDWN